MADWVLPECSMARRWQVVEVAGVRYIIEVAKVFCAYGYYYTTGMSDLEWLWPPMHRAFQRARRSFLASYRYL